MGSNAELAVTNEPYVPTNSILAKTQLPAWATFRERPIDRVNQMALEDAMSRSPEVRNAAERTRGMTDDGVLLAKDYQEIAAIVEGVAGFEPESFGGWLFKFGSFTEVVIPGKRNMLDYNLYLVRFPDEPWVLVSAKSP